MDFDFPGKRENEEKTEMEDDVVNQDFEVELDVEFWPVEHPVEPEVEDRPVKCPVPISSSVLHDEDRAEGRREMGAIRRTETPRAVRVVRKRHHSFTGSNNVITSPMIPISIVSPLRPPTASQQSNVTVFRVLQQVDHIES